MLPKPYYEEDGIIIYNADCRDILPHLEKVDLVLTDPPYGIGIAANPVRQKHAKSHWDDEVVDRDLLIESLERGDNAIVWGGNYFDLPPTQGFLIWDKMQPEGLTLAMCEMAWTSLSRPAKMFKERVIGYHKYHPTQKPERLMTWCIEWARDVNTILDPFMGSGTTLVAAKQLGRKAIGIELEEKYCKIAVERLRQGVLNLA